MDKDVDFLFEMGSIRFIDRMWRRFLGTDFANLAEHHFRVFWIATLIASHEKNVNMEKVMKMVMMHDISESRAGDVDYLARQYVQRNEELGIKDMLAGTAIEKEYLDLWQEYEDRKTLEAKIAKDADNLDVDFELAEQLSTGRVIHKQWVENRTFVSKNRLFTDTAKAMFKQIQAADPHRWHTEGRNRRTMGDWKK